MPRMARRAEASWGDWIGRRAEVVGLKRQEDFARIVGCSRERIVKWLAMPKPPGKMRKGFDRTLSRALQTTRQMLFVEYASVSPEDAPVLTLHEDQWFPDNAHGAFRPYPPEKVLQELIKKLKGDEYWKAVEYLSDLMMAQNDSRFEEIKHIRHGLGTKAPAKYMQPAFDRTAENLRSKKKA